MNGCKWLRLLIITGRILRMYKKANAIVKGVCFGMIGGAALMAIGMSAAKNNRKTLRRTASKALDTMENVVERFDSMLKG